MAQITFNLAIEQFLELDSESRKKFNAMLKPLIPKEFLPYKFEKSVPNNYKQVMIDSMNSLFTDEPHGLFFLGNVGIGKTTIMYILYRSYLLMRFIQVRHSYPEYEFDHRMKEMFHGVAFITYSELVRALRDVVDDKNFAYPNFAKYKVLFIDDLGRGYGDKAGWNSSLLDEFFDYRWSNQLPTFISTNRSEQTLTKLLSPDAVDRIFDRHWITQLRFTGESFRRKSE